MGKAKAEEIAVTDIEYPILSEKFFASGDLLKRVGNLLRNGKVNQTLLLSGPPSVGKTTLAYIISAALECEKPTPFACGKCLSCRKIVKGIFPDLRYITLKESETGKMRTQIVIEQVREEILKAAELPPYEGKKLIFIIEPSEALNANCQNALLKILEEPPPYVQFILIAKEVSRLLPTVRSRCQEITLKELSFEETLKVAEKLGLKEAEKAAEASRGRIGLLINGEWKEYLALQEIIQNLLIFGSEIKYFIEVSSKIEELLDFPENLVLDETLYIIKEIVKEKNGVKSQIRLKKEFLDLVSKNRLYKQTKKCIEATEMLNRNVSVKLIYNYIYLGE
ncbi:MAG: AAA family ATPase [Thermoanaerobaculaceae bacterium]|nr:AAA family ATPase [Thermoanaerobaculaceae bacterium]